MKTQGNATKSRGRPAGKSRSEIQLVGYLRRDAMLKALHGLVAEGRIGHFWCVEHEPDEETKKPHFHVRMTPPLSRAVDWSEIVSSVVEDVSGESLPRRLVASSRAVNDQGLDGLLYARHDSRYCQAKNLVKARCDYPRDAFFTDSQEWLDGLWAASDSFEPSPRKLTREEMLSFLESNPAISHRELLRLCLVNCYSLGDYRMFSEYRSLLINDNPKIRHEDLSTLSD